MKPRVAWLVYDVPFPTNSGGKLRASNLIKNLVDEFTVDLFCFYRKSEQLSFLKEIQNLFGQVKVYRRHPVWDLKNLFRNVFFEEPLLNISYLNGDLRRDLSESASHKSYDLYHFEFLGMAGYLPLVKNLGGKAVMGNENVEYEIYGRFASRSKLYPLIPLYKYDVWKMKRLEEKIWLLADANLAVCEEDAKKIETVTGRGCAIVPNGVEILPRRPIITGGRPGRKGFPTAFFAGDLNYQQNYDGLKWFMDEVLAGILKEIPDFKLRVLSRTPAEFLNKYGPSVELISDSESPFENFVFGADVFISPIRVKSGTNIKVLQAAANGLPIVGTSLSFAGYDFSGGRDVLIADQPEAFAHKVVEVLRNSGLAESLAKNAFERAGGYSWQNSAKILKDVYRKLIS
ncbi:MAG: glycosyltransferase family 4 protein [Patescibacteria group bacterium]|nr:glycosyltransferase family 4 protein [Patescibacteria group bacterium]